MSWALQVQWLWLRKTDPSKPWLSLEIPAHPNVLALFQIAMETTIGNGLSTKFWKDKWILGKSISDWAPLVVAAVPARTRNSRLVVDAMVNNRWAQDIQGGLSIVGQYECWSSGFDGGCTSGWRLVGARVRGGGEPATPSWKSGVEAGRWWFGGKATRAERTGLLGFRDQLDLQTAFFTHDCLIHIVLGLTYT